MDLSLSEDQRSVQQVFSSFFAKESTPERVRKSEDSGFDADLWAAVVAAGLPTMGIEENRGGAGASMIELALVVREMGRRLAPIPLIEVIVAGRLLSESSAGHELVEQIATGNLIPTLALRSTAGGIARLVPAGAIADVVIALHGERLVMVREADRTDQTQPPLNLGSMALADRRVEGDGVEVTVLAEGPHAVRLHDNALTQWKLLTAAALSGLQAQAEAIGVEYIQGRQVFGTTLAWFQAVQHRFADVSTEGRGAELLVLEAAWAHDEDPDSLAPLADMAFLFASDIAFRTTRESLQFHGGYGYTLEYDIQMYHRRAKAWPLVLGPTREVYAGLADRLFSTSVVEGGAA